MSRSAGRVLIIPCGDYDATRTYQMLDSVEYNGTSYLCKQQSTGNLPTNKTYWQAMGAAGSGVSNFITLSEDERADFLKAATITKAAGANEDVSLVFEIANNDLVRAANVKGIIYARLGQIMTYVSGGVYTDLTLTNVIEAVDDSSITAVGKLVNDTTSAINLTEKWTYLYTHNDENTGNIVGAGGASVTERGVALGKLATASDNGAIALGDETVAKGSCSTAEGYRTTAGSLYSHAEGTNTYAMGVASHTEGINTWARGDAAHAGGKDIRVTGDYSLAHGEGLSANRNNQLIAGKYNSDYSYSGKTPLMAIGNGTDSEHRSNAFTVYMDGFISCGDGHNRFKLTNENGAWGFYDNSNVFHVIGAIELVQSVTLDTTGETTVTFSNVAITADANLEVLTDVFGLYPSDVVSSGSNHTCTVKFPQAESADTINVKLRIS